MKTSRRDIWLMLVPVLLLAGVGIAIRNRQGPRLLVGPNKFRLTIEGVRHEALTPREVYDGYDTKIAVDLSYRGETPAWWGKQNGNSGSNVGEWSLVLTRNGKLRTLKYANGAWPNTMRWRPAYDKERDRYTARYLTSLSTLPAGDEIRLRDRLAVEDINGKLLCPPVWLDVRARKRGQGTNVPQVSKDTGFTFVRYEVDDAPPIETNGQGPQWQVRFFSRTTGPDSANRSVFADSELHDARGQVVASTGQSGPVDEPLGAAFAGKRARIQGYFNNLSFGSTLRPPTGPLWIVAKVYSGDKWPMPMRIPFRDARGKILLSPRSQPQFHVVGSSVAPATADNKKEMGADTTATFVIRPLGTPAKSLDEWQWHTNHSQHVEDATGKSYYQLPFTGISQQPAIAECGFTIGSKSEMTISYHLNLSKIPKTAGPLTFKAELSANGSKRVPVSVMVRK